jgi:PKD repeat protein
MNIFYRLLALIILIGGTTTTNAQIQLELGSDTTFCAPDSIVLSATQTGGSIYQYHWISTPSTIANDSISTQVISSSGTYIVEVTDTVTKIMETDTIVIIVNPLPIINLEVDSVCLGEAITILNSAITTNNQYSWNYDDSTTIDTTYQTSSLSHTYNTKGNYTIKVTVLDTISRCSIEDSIPTIVYFQPIATLSVDSICLPDSILITNNSIIDSLTYIYVDYGIEQDTLLGSINNWHYNNYMNPGSYPIIVETRNNQCYDIDTITTLVSPLPIVNAGLDFIVCHNPNPNNIILPQASPIDGLWSGNGVINDTLGLFRTDLTNISYPNNATSGDTIGQVLLTYTFVDSFGCSNNDTIAGTIIQPVEVVTPTLDTVCLSENTYSLSNYTPSGGTWIINDTLTQTINTLSLSTLGVGLHTIVYSFGDSTCEVLDTTSLFIAPIPTIEAGSNFSICLNSENETLSNYTPIGGSWSGIGVDSTGVFSPSQAGIGSFELVYSYTDTNTLCYSYDTLMATVNDIPAISISTVSACSGDSVQLSRSLNSDFTLGYSWSFGDSAPIDARKDSIFHYQYNTTGIYDVILSVTDSNSCISSDTTQVGYYKIPVSSFQVDTVCLNSANKFINTSTNVDSSTSYQILWGDATSSTSNNLDSSYHLYPTADTFYTEIIVTNGGICADTTNNSAVIKPGPTLNVSISEACIGGLNTVLNTSIPDTNTIYSWDFSNNMISDTSAATFDLFYSSVDTFDVTVTLSDTLLGCAHTDTISAIVLAIPEAGFTIDTVCFRSPTTLINTSDSVYSSTDYTFHFGDGTSMTVTGFDTLQYTYSTSDSFSVTMISATGSCTDTSSNQLTLVKPAPTAHYSVDSTCLGSMVHFSTSSFTNNVIAYWDFGNDSTRIDSSYIPNFTYLYQNNGLYTTTLNLIDTTNSCSHSDTVTSLVRIVPNVAFAVDTVCFGNEVTITNTSISTPETVFFIDYGDGDLDTIMDFSLPITHLYNLPNSYIIQIMADNNGCTDTSTQIALVKEQPIADYSVNEVCFNEKTTFTNLSTSTTPNAIYSWEFGDNTTSDTIAGVFTHLYNQNGTTFSSRLIIDNQNGCIDTSSLLVNTLLKPVADFAVDNVGCDNTNTNFTNNSSSLSDTALYLFNYGDFNSLSSITFPTTHSYNTPSSYNIELIVENDNSCRDTTYQAIVIKQQPKIYSISVAPVCFGDTSIFIQSSTALDTATYTWQYGDGRFDTLNNQNTTFSHYYTTNNNTYNGSLTIDNKNGCTAILNFDAVILQQPTANFSIDSSICANTNVLFNDATTQVSNNATFNFNYGNGIDSIYSSFVPNYIYTTEGTYSINLTVDNQNGCTSIATTTTVVQRQPVADFSIDSAICDGNTVSINNSSSSLTANAQLYLDYDYTLNTNINEDTLNGNLSSNHLYSSTGTYTIRGTIDNQNGCISIKDYPVIVNAQPIADYSIDTVCFGSNSTFANSSTSKQGADFIWTYGDGNIDTMSSMPNISHFYGQNNTTYASQLFIDNKNGCVDSTFVNAVIKLEPNANYSVSDVCDGQAINILNLTTAINSNTLYYVDYNNNYDVDRDTLSYQFNYNHLYDSASTYIVSITADNQNGCFDTHLDTLTVHSQPIAIFSADTICYTDTTTLTNTSISVDSALYIWTYGDGNIDTLNHTNTTLKHYYSNNNTTYLANLLIDNKNGCQNSLAKSIVVKFQPFAIYSVDTICWKDSTSFINTSISASNANYIWSYGDGDTSFLQDANFTHLYDTNGVVLTSSLYIDNINGCTSYLEKNIVVRLTPVASFEIDTVCHYLPNTLLNTSTFRDPNIEYTVDYADGNINTLSSSQFDTLIQYTYNQPGTYDVQVLTDNKNGCIDSMIINGYVRTLPNVYFTDTLEYSEYCALDGPDLVQGFPSPGYFYSPTYPDSNIIMLDSMQGLGLFSPSSADTNISLIYVHTDIHTCTNYDTQYVNIIRALPKPYFITPVPDEFCVGDPVLNLEAGLLDTTEFSITDIYTNFSINDTLGGGIPELVIDSILGDHYARFNPMQTDTNIYLFITVIDTHQCGNAAFKNITIHRLPPIVLPDVVTLTSGNPPIEIETMNQQSDYNYLWSTGDVTPSIFVLNGGFYTLTVTNTTTGCVNADTLRLDVIPHTNEIEVIEEFRLFPNPVQSYLNYDIMLANQYDVKDALIEIYDMSGRLVHSENKHIISEKVNQINVSSLSEGLYLFRLLIDGKQLTTEFLKE